MPLTGHIVSCGCGVAFRLTQIDPMARSVGDLFPLLRIVAGPDGRDPSVCCTDADVEESCPEELAGLDSFWALMDVVDGGKWIRDLLERSGTTRWDPHIEWFQAGTALSGEDFSAFLRTRQRFRADLTRRLVKLRKLS